MTENEALLIQATMDIVAEKGLDGFSMKQVTNRVGVSEALLYKYFDTKDNLLLQCFMSVNRQISALFKAVKVPKTDDLSELAEFLHALWKKYFCFMVENGNRSLFYYAYRESTYLQKVLMSTNKEVADDMAPFMSIATELIAKFKPNAKVPIDYLWVFLIEGTGGFVKQALSHQYSIKELDVDSIWLLMAGGLRGLVK